MFHGEQGPVAYLVSLNLRQQPDVSVLALNTYCRAFPVGDSLLGVWCPEYPTHQAQNAYIRVLCFDPEQLKPFPLSEVAGWFKQSNERVYAATAPLAEFEVSCALPPGTHKIDVPPEFRGVPELLLVTSYPAAGKDDPACAILALAPGTGTVEVLPQKWFTASKVDVGYQWVTRVARDPVSHRLVGDGIRIGKFELTDDGCDVERWLE